MLTIADQGRAAAWLDYLQGLPLAQQVAQLVVVRAAGTLFDGEIRYPAWEPPAATLQTWLAEVGVGGVILLGGSAAEVALRTAQLRDWAAVPPLIAADVEEGVGQRFAGATWCPPPLALAAIARTDPDQACRLAAQMGAITAQEAAAIGLNWVLAPVVDVNNNPANPVINVRAFGETPEIVAQLATAFIAGAQPYPVALAAKHFPGHGDTATDSHLDLPVLSHDPARLAAIELPPFQRAIAAGIDAVMTAHLHIPTWDPTHPATLSAPILTGQLREKLGFTGVIVTDALVMGAISNRYGAAEAAVLAVAAGADIVLMPADPVAAIAALVAAVESGRIGRDRLQQSLTRIAHLKARVLDPPHAPAADRVNSPASTLATGLTHQLAQPDAIATVDAILTASQIRGGDRLMIPNVTDSPATSHPAAPPPTASKSSPKAAQLAATQLAAAQLAATQLAATQLAATQLANEDLENLGTLASVAHQGRSPRNLILTDDALLNPCLGQHVPAIALPRQWGLRDLQIIDSYSAADPNQLNTTPGRQPPTLLQLFVRGNPFRGSAGASATAERWVMCLLDAQCLIGVVIYGSPYLLQALQPQWAQRPGGDRLPFVFTYGQMPRAQAIALNTLITAP